MYYHSSLPTLTMFETLTSKYNTIQWGVFSTFFIGIVLVILVYLFKLCFINDAFII